jgi:hypothetical protein
MAQTSQNIQGFYTQLQDKDFARKNLFRVLNIDLGGDIGLQFGEDELVYATTAKLPARDNASQAVPFMGLAFNVPGVAKYPGSDAYVIRFRCDEQYNLREAFLRASRATFDDETSTGAYFAPKPDSVIDLVLLDKQLDRAKQYQLVGVAIKSVGEIDYDQTGDGEIVEFDVTVTYHYFKETSPQD